MRGLAGEIISRFERAGLKIIGMKMLSPDEEHYYHHYETISKLKSRIGEDVFNQNSKFMMSGPVIAVVLEGVEAVATVRNIIHASGNKEEAEQEVAHWFSDQELFEYQTVHEHLTQNP
jgi:nucleoside-diphosphate kinase